MMSTGRSLPVMPVGRTSRALSNSFFRATREGDACVLGMASARTLTARRATSPRNSPGCPCIAARTAASLRAMASSPSEPTKPRRFEDFARQRDAELDVAWGAALLAKDAHPHLDVDAL